MDFEKGLHNHDYGFDVFGYKEKEDVPIKTSDKTIKENKDTNQIVVRTNKYSFEELESKLSEGYKVKYATQLGGEYCIVEYILEK